MRSTTRTLLCLLFVLSSVNAVREARGYPTRIKSPNNNNNNNNDNDGTTTTTTLKKNRPVSRRGVEALKKDKCNEEGAAPSKGSTRRMEEQTNNNNNHSSRISQTGRRNRTVRRTVNAPSKGSSTVGAPSKGSGSTTDYEGGNSTVVGKGCTEAPTSSPTDVPTTSPTPIPTASPTNAPTNAPTNGATVTSTVKPECQAFENGQVFTTSIKADISYNYELQRKDGTDLAAVLSSLEGKIGNLLGAEVLNCTSTTPFRGRRLSVSVSSSTMEAQRNRRRLQTAGIDMAPADTASEDVCADVALAQPNAVCTIIKGDFTLYLEESSSASKREAAEEALTVVKNGMANGDFVDEDIIKVHYMGADLSGIETGTTGGGSSGGSTGSASGATQQIGSGSSSKISGMGISLIVLAVFGGAVVALVAVRRNRQTNATVDEIFEEEDTSVFTKQQSKANLMNFRDIDEDTACTSSTYSNWRKTRNAHVYGEDDSVMSGYNEGILDQLQSMERNRGLEEPGPHDHVDVHHCTSAMCDRCVKTNNTTFVASSYLGALERDTPDPVVHGARSYKTDDTVEF